MERPIFKPIGTPTEQLDTPSLIVDVDALDHNIATVAGFFESSAAKLRPHVESHRTPANRAQAVGQAAVTSAGSPYRASVRPRSSFPTASPTFSCANLVVTPQKITRLCALARQARIGVAVDSPSNVADLSRRSGRQRRMPRCGRLRQHPPRTLRRRTRATRN